MSNWSRIEELYHCARDLTPGQRSRYLQEECPDEALRGEVESLLASDAEAATFLESPALEVTAKALAAGRSQTMIGRALGPYEIVEFIGAGGMGEVYRARDSRMGRYVAVKVLPPGIVADAERLRRFEQEARATAALNHPNILGIYDVGLDDSAPYVVYEFLDGETLRERLRHGRLPRRKALDYGRQIALGLAAAHDNSIIHRDLKPANVFLTRDGRVKILDFGLAKLAGPEQWIGTGESPSVQSSASTTLGTPGYMAPEQVRARSADHRSDLFNVGAILYEMLTAQPPFRGASTREVLSAILEHDPIEAPETSGAFDPALARVLRRCLEKNPGERVQSAQDLAFDLETLSSTSVERQSASRRKRSLIRFAVPAAVLAAAAFLGGRELERARAHISPTFHRLTYRAGVITGARFAPGGDSVIYSAAWDGRPVQTFAMRLGGPESRTIGLPQAGVLAVSSAGELALSLGCELNWAECRGTLARVPVAGGAPREVLEDVFYADWSPDGKDLAVVRAVDGRFRLEYPIGKLLYEASGWITYPRVSPKGDRVAFLDHPALGDDNGSVIVVDTSGRKTVVAADWKNLKGLAWSPEGDEVWFSADRSARSQRVYAATLSGHVRMVLQAPGWMRLQEIAHDGRVLLLQANPRSRILYQSGKQSRERDLSWFDWSTVADLSPDGRTLLFYEWGEGVAGNPTVYMRDTSGADAVRLGEGRALALSPTGDFALALRSRPPATLVLLPTGPGEEKRLPSNGLNEYYSATWFPDGKRILFVAAGADARPHSYIQDINGGAASPIRDATIQAVLVSPDAKLLAGITSDGEYVLYAIHEGSTRKIRGVLPGDDLIQWSSNGRYLYVREQGESKLSFCRLDLATGRRERWKTIEFADPVGMIGVQQSAIHMSADGKSIAYSYWKTLTDLYVVENLR